MDAKWEYVFAVPSADCRDESLRLGRQLVGYAVRAVFSRPVVARDRAMPINFLQTHRGFPRRCPELYCSSPIRLEEESKHLCFHGRGQALSCYEGHRFAAFRFHRLMILGKLELYLARLGEEKWRRIIGFPALTLYGRELLRALWNAPFEEVLCGPESVPSPRGARTRLQRRMARELSAADRLQIAARVSTCLDLCSERLRPVQDFSSGIEYACDAGHRALFSRSERGTFLASRLVLSYTAAAESL